MGSQCSYVLFLDNLDIRGKLVDILVLLWIVICYLSLLIKLILDDNRAHVRWCHRLRVWTLRNWRRIWFNNESRFLLQWCDGRTLVYMHTGSWQKPHDVGNNILKTYLVPVQKNWTSHRYRDDILQRRIHFCIYMLNVIDRQRKMPCPIQQR
jgi:hypothetical protein